MLNATQAEKIAEDVLSQACVLREAKIRPGPWLYRFRALQALPPAPRAEVMRDALMLLHRYTLIGELPLWLVIGSQLIWLSEPVVMLALFAASLLWLLVFRMGFLRYTVLRLIRERAETSADPSP